MTIGKVLIVGVACLGLTGVAKAADIFDAPLESAPLVPVEVGSGWYLRGDVSYDFKSDVDVKFDRSYVDTNGVDFSDHGSVGGISLKDNADFGIGFGYQFTDMLRGDLTAHYWESKLKLSGAEFGDTACLSFPAGFDCSSENSEAKTWELMANAYLDLGTFAGFTPYVGGGVGAARVKYTNFSALGNCFDANLCNADASVEFDGANDWRFAYALTGGISYDIAQNLKLDVGYRYVNVDGGDVAQTPLNGGTMSFKDDGFDRHTIQAGLRYSLF
ncbi:outer membrane protein [Aureimonas psammosilenae]|uniref:outer membrane protein n=1 Tax=Aureimonas psammosilenae TaxID=2495496 RepID=UPI00126048DC|nr:outer membrane protein [Aureimonas psammosilenae]